MLLSFLRRVGHFLSARLFFCPACNEKDKRIADLQSEITRLYQLVHPQAYTRIPSPVQLESDFILSGGASRPPEITTVSHETRTIIAERDRILSGTY